MTLHQSSMPKPDIGRESRFLPTPPAFDALLVLSSLVHWPLMAVLLHLVQRGGDSAGCGHVQSPRRCTKYNSTPINGQCTNYQLHIIQCGTIRKISKLSSSFKGCCMILYADDILILSPSVSQLEHL